MNIMQNLFLVTQFRVYYNLRQLVNRSFSVLEDDDGLAENTVLVLKEYIFGEFQSLEKARMRELVYWYLRTEENRINNGAQKGSKSSMSRKKLEMYCAKAPTGTGAPMVDGGYVFDHKKIGALAARLVEQQRDEVVLGVWRVHIARGEGLRTRILSSNLMNLAVPAEIEHLILEALTVKCVSSKKSGFSFEDYHVIEMEILEAMG